ncbi:MAG: hypothetical protein K2H53_06180 [Clostridia bacterium]|nr:hypothetical protein [Clostridia bacterium]
MKNTKVDSKRIGLFIAIALILIVIIAIITSGSKNKNNVNGDNPQTGTTVVEGKKLAETKIYKGLEISNVKLTVKDDGMTGLTANVANNTGADTEGQYINIYILDENGKRITDFGGFIDPIEAGSSTMIYADFLTNGIEDSFYNIEITEKREEEQDTNSDNTENGENTGSEENNTDEQ